MAVKNKKTSSTDRCPEKESLIRELIKNMETTGFEVRREKLKQGPGWKVTSGSCRLEAKKIVFLDSRLSQDDQIEFLKSKMTASPSEQCSAPQELPI